MLISLPDSPVYKSMPMSSHCNYISREDVGGNKAPTNTIVFPFNRGNYPQDLGRTVVMGRVGGPDPDNILEILNLPRYSIPVTLVHIYKTELPTAHLEPDD